MADEDTPTVDGPSVPRRVVGAVQAEVDGELVLLSPADFGYFGAEGPGPDVWALVDGERSVDAIVAELAGSYDVAAEEISGDVVDFVTALVAAGLAEV